MPRVGIIKVTPDLLLEWLQFKGGSLREISLDHDTGLIDLVIEHPEMLEVEGVPQVVTPSYTKHFLPDKMGHIVVVREPL